jgi:hypothetical protein
VYPAAGHLSGLHVSSVSGQGANSVNGETSMEHEDRESKIEQC